MRRWGQGMSQQNSRANWQKAAAIACSIGLALPSWAQVNPVLVGIVTAVLEGDTIKVQLSSGPIIVRLANIDAPEPRQPGGLEARNALNDRLIGEEITLDVTPQDRDERLIAVVYLGDENINAWLVKQGHAWAYRQNTEDPDYCVWENGARSLRRGFWAREESLAPWEWRQGGRGKAIRYTNYSRETAANCIAAMK